MKNYEHYVAYFENLATQSPHINHDPENNVKGFFTIQLEETLTGIRSKIDASGIFLVLTDYVWKPNQVSGNYFKQGEGMFYVLGTVTPGDFEKHKQVMTQTEEIATKLINRIHLDSRKDQGNPDSVWFGAQNVLDFDNATPLQAKTGLNHFGWQVLFRFGSKWNECVSVEDWNDKETADSVNPNT